MSVPKVLVVGAVKGLFEKAFQKISKLHAKQNFSFAIIVGDLFASQSSEQSEAELTSLIDGSIKVPLTTYFTLGDHTVPTSVQNALEASGEVTTNLFYLGRKGTLKTTEGIRIVNLGGRLVQNEASLTQKIGKYEPLYTEADARSLHGAHSADILITNQWPVKITENSQVAVPETIDTSTSTQSVANLCLALKPRYHFASSPSAMWSREPFMIPASAAVVQGRQLKSYEDLDGPVRFTSLASVQSSNKECLSAFNLDPTKPSTTEGAQQICPLSDSAAPTKRKRDARVEDEASTSNYRYSTDHHHHNKYDDNPRHSRRHNNKNNKRQKNFDPSSCFMCMSNHQFDASMVISIAEESFLTSVKGALPIRGQTFPALKSSGHVLIIPMYHAADEASHGKRELTDLNKEFTEMTKYRQSLQRFLGSKGLGSVCWEVNRTGIRHFHWQLMACPKEMIASGMVEAAYKVAAERYKIRPSSTTTTEEGHSNDDDTTSTNQKETEEDHDKESKMQPIKFQPCDPDLPIPNQRSDFFRVWTFNPDPDSSSTSSSHQYPPSPIETADSLSNGQPTKKSLLPYITGAESSMYFPIPSNLKFNIAFGREVMASLMDLEQRTDWKACVDGHPGGNKEGKTEEEIDALAFQDEFQRPLGESDDSSNGGTGGVSWDFAMMAE